MLSIISSLSDYVSTVWYYCRQYWIDVGDPRTRDYPLASGGPEIINDYSADVMLEIRMGFFCYMTRFMDLLDTVFFVLRKKYNQITFLHLYHHTLVPIMGWMCLKIAPQAPVIGLFLLFNTFIHSIMYLYYALAAFGPNVRKYLWWKKYITQLQLLQFATCFCYGVAMVFLQTGFPPGLFWLGFAQNPFFFYMFYQFYRQAYYPDVKKKDIKIN